MVEDTTRASKKEAIEDLVEDAYTKSYKMRIVGPGSVEATIPRPIVEREARKLGLTIEEFIGQYRVEYLFNDFGVAFVGRFIRGD